MPSRRRALVVEVHAFHEKGFQYECLISLEKCGDGKRYRCVVGCNICNMYDIWKHERYGDVFSHLEIGVVR